MYHDVQGFMIHHERGPENACAEDAKMAKSIDYDRQMHLHAHFRYPMYLNPP